MQPIFYYSMGCCGGVFSSWNVFLMKAHFIGCVMIENCDGNTRFGNSDGGSIPVISMGIPVPKVIVSSSGNLFLIINHTSLDYYCTDDFLIYIVGGEKF